jgi:hypothetical protein
MQQVYGPFEIEKVDTISYSSQGKYSGTEFKSRGNALTDTLG